MNDDPNRLVLAFTEALQVPVEERAAYLDRVCAGDNELRRRVEALLEAHEGAGDFLEQPATEMASEAGQEVAVGVKLGDLIGRYKLLQQIGEGGWGVVFMAEQAEPVRRTVALKIVKPGMDTKSVIARFEAERQALAMMDHPNIAMVFDAGATESGKPYFVMELVRGAKLTDYCEEQALSAADRLDLFIQVCHAVQHAHQKGIIHRDLKPSNILVTTTAEGKCRPKVIDFGIAKATAGERLTDKTLFTSFELLIGTPAYMSPEQAALTSLDIDTRSDIYSLGVLLYELLTSKTPFDTHELLKTGLDEVRRVIQNEEPLRPSARLRTLDSEDLIRVAGCRRTNGARLIRTVTGDLDWIVMKALEKDRSRRYQTANGLALDVQQYLAGEAILARPPSAFYRLQRAVLRNKLFFAAVGIILLLLVGGLAGATWLLKKERDARRDASAARLQAERERGGAQREATRSKQVTRFLGDMLGSVGPSVAVGRDATMLREILEDTVRRLNTDLASQPEVRGDLLQRLGRTYCELGQYGESESLLRQALKIAIEVSGQDSEATAGAMSELGHVLSLQLKHDEAESTIRKALSIRVRFVGENSMETAESLLRLGGTLYGQNRLPEAEATLRKSLAIYRVHPGETASRNIEPLVGLGSVLHMQGKFSEAETIYREALSQTEPVLGKEHPTVCAILQNLAAAMGDQGKRQEAEALTRQVVETRRKVLGENHPLLVNSLHSLAVSLMRQQKYEEAEGLYRQAISLASKLYGRLDPRLNRMFRELGSVLQAQGKRKEFESLLSSFLTPEVVSERESSSILAIRLELYARSGRWRDASQDAFKILEHEPADHMSYHNLVPLLAAQRDIDQYRRVCQTIVDQFANTTDPLVADRMAKDCLILPFSVTDLQPVTRMAEIAVTMGRNNPALPLLQCCRALADYRRDEFTGAIEWANRALVSKFPYVQAQAYAITAMAHFRLNQLASAQDALSKATRAADSDLPTIESGDLGQDWRDWIIAHALLTEARNLIEGKPLPER